MVQDLRHALRSLRKSPGFTAVAVLTLGLGIGANSAIFSVVDAYLLRDLPYPHADRLVSVYDVQSGYGTAPASFLEWRDIQEHGEMFDAVAASFSRSMNYVGHELPERVRVMLVDPQYFDLHGVAPVVGRLFVTEEDAEGGAGAIVVTESFWRTRLAGQAAALGDIVRFSDRPYTVVGVVPDAAVMTGTPIVGYVPLAANAPWRDRGTHYLTVTGRLRDGLALDAARARLDALADRLRTEHETDHGLFLQPLRTTIAGDARGLLFALLGAVGFVLLIATANVANLMLVRAAGRGAEFAVRTALGATRVQLVRQLLTESLVLGLMGAAAGTLLGVWGTQVLVEVLPGSLRRLAVAFDVRVLGFTVLVALVASLVVGAAPAMLELRKSIGTGITGARAAGGTKDARRARSALVVIELALSLVLLIGATLMIQGFARLLKVDPGFQARELLTLSTNLPPTRYPDNADRVEFVDQLTARLSALAGVDRVAVANNRPFGGSMNGSVRVEDAPEQAGPPNAEKRIVSEDYFRALGVPLLRGRLFTAADREGAPMVAIVSQSLAEAAWPGEDPLGKRIASLTCGDGCWETVIGVVGNVREYTLHDAAPMAVYYPLRQIPLSGMNILVKTAGDPTRRVAPIRRAVADLDPVLPVYNVRTMQESISASVADRRLTTFLLGTFALVAVLLAAVGVAGVISYAVSQKTREIGLRVALGSTSHQVVGMIVRQGMRLAVLALAAGLPAGFLLARLLRSQLYDLPATHPAAYGAAALLLTFVAGLACYVPARRAAQVDPIVALRHD